MSGKYLVKPGDIIYSKIRPALNKACIATGEWLCSADMYPVAITAKDLTSVQDKTFQPIEITADCREQLS